MTNDNAFAPHCCVSVLSLPVETGSRRRKLWELDDHAHCPVVGLCLSTDALRRLARKVLGGEPLVDDYELHCGAVADSKARTRFAEGLHKLLDQLHAGALREAAVCKSSEQLSDWWQSRRGGTQMPGALWALLTHARCNQALERQALGDVHMRQHALGHAQRGDAQRATQLEAELAQARHQLQMQQQRAQQTAQAQSAALVAAQAQTVRLRGQLLARDTELAQALDQLQRLRSLQPSDLPEREQLQQRLVQQQERLQSLHRELQRGALASPAPVAPPPIAAPVAIVEQPIALPERSVLCVGGRPSCVPAYRRTIEDAGARFLHHDGGTEDNPQKLTATLSAADLVICQTGCISHDAYWRVKDHCKRYGTPCVFVRNPSTASLQRALQQASDNLEPT